MLSGRKLTKARRISVLLYGYIHGEGGIQTHTRYLAEGLRERGHSVKIISPAPMISHDHSEEGLNSGLEYGTYRSVRDLVHAVRSGGSDVIVIVGTGWKAMAAALMARRTCKKIFFEVMSGARNSGMDPRSLVNFGFDAVVGQGSSVTRRFAKEFGWRGSTTTIPALPEPLESFGPIPRRSLRDTTNGIRFAHFGRLAEHKNVALLVDRFNDYAPPGSILDIWGGGSNSEAISTLIEKNGLGGAIRMRGRYPEGRAYIELLQSYDLKLLPTVGEEGAPLVLLEAMACGLPFVANGVGGIPDYDNPDCVITNGNIGDFIPSVIAMVQRLRSNDIDAARLQCCYEDRFSYKRLVDRWEDMLTSAVRGTDAHGRRRVT